MREDLLNHYERELSYLRRVGVEFAERYPKIASRLQLEPDKCEDPHVERLIEAFAFLSARVQLKLEDELPQITEALLDVLYPSYLAPVPSLSIVQFTLDPDRINLQAGSTIPRGSTVASRPVRGTPCRFRTCYPLTIWPIELTSAHFDLPPVGQAMADRAGVAVGGKGAPRLDNVRTVLKMELRTFGGLPLGALKEKVSDTEERPLSTLRFFLHAESKVAHGLYELVFNDLSAVELRYGSKAAPRSVLLPPSSIKTVGFDRDDGLLPYTDRSFLGYRLLKEYFTFPEKFLFFEVTGLERFAAEGVSTDAFELRLHLAREFPHEKVVSDKTFRLHTVPIVNLFNKIAEPIRLTHLASEYQVVPDVRSPLSHEIYSVESVVSTSPGRDTKVTFQPFYSFRHGADREQQKAFWYASRKSSARKDDEGTDVYLSLVDLGFDPAYPSEDTLTIHTVCSNRDLPGELPFGSADGDFNLEGPGVYSAIRCLVKPTRSKRLPMQRRAQWRLISHLSLNYLSLMPREGSEDPEALREILKLYDVSDSSVTRQQIAGITKVAARRVLRAIGPSHAAFVRGLEVSLELDESQFIGTGVFLFASVLERFLGLYASINSFSQLVLTTRQREGILRRWPPRSGEEIVL